MASALSPYMGKGRAAHKETLSEKKILEHAEKVEDTGREKDEIEVKIRDLEEKIQWFTAWGAFNPKDLDILKQNGLFIRCYRLNKDDFKKKLRDKKFFLIKKDRKYAYIIFMGLGAEEKLEFEEMLPPLASPGQMTQEIAGLKNRISAIEGFLKEEARALDTIARSRKKLIKERESMCVMFGMQEEGEFSYLQGFCPVKMISGLTTMAKKHGLGYCIEEPDDPDETPTLITNPAWVRIIKPVFQFMNTLPGYGEFDISFVFMLFFSMFFAMLIGDAGYGFLFLTVTFIARSKLKRLPQEPFFLLYLQIFAIKCPSKIL